MVVALAVQNAYAVLVSHWTFDEGSGTIAYDAVGPNDGIIYGATWTNGISGEALSFDGVNDYVNMGDIDITTGITLSAWVYVTDYMPDPTYSFGEIMSKEDSAYELGIWEFDIKFIGQFGSTDSSYDDLKTSGWPLGVDAWHHVAATYDGDKMRIYVDGVEEANKNRTGNINTNNTPVWVGGRARGAGIYWFQGKIDDVRIYSHALSDADIGILYLQMLMTGGLQTQLNNLQTQVNGLQNALNGKASTVHYHAISDVTGLEGVLDDTVDVNTYNIHTHDKGSGGRNTSIPTPQIIP